MAFSRNLGFAAAANEGIARTRSAFVLLVNNDAVLAPDYAARLAARLALDDRLAAVQGLVLTEDGSRVDTAGLDWNRRGEAVPILAGAPPEEAPGSVFEVSGVSATATLYRRAALESVASAGRDLRALLLRLLRGRGSLAAPRARGMALRLRPGAAARHEGSRTGRRTPVRRALWTARNRWRTLFRNFDSRLIARNLFPLLRADLAHVRNLGWKGALLPVLVWPRLPVLAWRSRDAALLSDWPGPVRSWSADRDSETGESPRLRDTVREITVILVSWNDAEDLRACVESLAEARRRMPRRRPARLSRRGRERRRRRRRGDPLSLAGRLGPGQRENRGFGPAANQGARPRRATCSCS